MRILVGILATFLGRGVYAAEAGRYLELSLKQDHYLGEGQTSTQPANYTFATVDLNLENDTRNLHYKFNPIVQDAIGVQNEFYVGVPELYIQPIQMDNGFALTVGRQKRMWSRLDEEFNLGVWQPQLRWDYLQPMQQGLIGIFFDFPLDNNFRLTLFTSPLYLPDQGPNYALDNGQFTSNNRWFSPPQSRVQLFGDAGVTDATPLFFQIDRPAEEKIIMNSSFGIGLAYQDSGSPFWISLNWAYKPQNQLHLGVECSNCLNISGSSEVTLIIHPEVVKDHVVTLETGFDAADDKGYISLTGDFPNESDFPDRYIESPLDSEAIAGAAYEHSIASVIGLPSWLKASYMKVFDIQSRDKKGLVDSEAIHSSLDRYPYRELASVEWKMTAFQKLKNRIDVKTRYSYSVPEKGGWLALAGDWCLGSMTWTLGADVIGSGVSDDSANAGLFTKYRSNDRIYGGASYVF
jgi:hypothetical protein